MSTAGSKARRCHASAKNCCSFPGTAIPPSTSTIGTFACATAWSRSYGRSRRVARCIRMKKFLVAVFAGLAPVTAAAHGALAIGLPQSVEHEGFAYGVTWDFPNVSEAAERAMKRCREENV